MRARLRHPLRESRHGRRRSRAPEPAPRRDPAALEREAPADSSRLRIDDGDVRRAREAGGPLDRASYNCSCGMQFDAAVSTSVACPHCGTEQAW
jgi:hypothetical protein